MGNSFNISVAPEIAALEDKVDIIDTVVDTIRSTDVVNIEADIAAIDADIVTIDTVVDAIKAKTDATPQKVRGQIISAYSAGVYDNYEDVCNVTGQGKIYLIAINVTTGTDTISVKLTLDGKVFVEVTHTGDTANHFLFPSLSTIASANIGLTKIEDTGQFPPLFNLSFENTLLLQHKRSAGTTSGTTCKILYILDDF